MNKAKKQLIKDILLLPVGITELSVIVLTHNKRLFAWPNMVHDRSLYLSAFVALTFAVIINIQFIIEDLKRKQ